jgi:hypothetical protein
MNLDQVKKALGAAVEPPTYAGVGREATRDNSAVPQLWQSFVLNNPDHPLIAHMTNEAIQRVLQRRTLQSLAVCFNKERQLRTFADLIALPHHSTKKKTACARALFGNATLQQIVGSFERFGITWNPNGGLGSDTLETVVARRLHWLIARAPMTAAELRALPDDELERLAQYSVKVLGALGGER